MFMPARGSAYGPRSTARSRQDVWVARGPCWTRTRSTYTRRSSTRFCIRPVATRSQSVRGGRRSRSDRVGCIRFARVRTFRSASTPSASRFIEQTGGSMAGRPALSSTATAYSTMDRIDSTRCGAHTQAVLPRKSPTSASICITWASIGFTPDSIRGSATRHATPWAHESGAWWGEWGYDTEAMYQFGRFGAGDIRAWRGIANGWRTWPTVGWRPRIEGVVDIASGDKNRSDADLQTFNSLFQTGTYSARDQLLGPYNSIRLEPSIVVSPWPTVAVSGGWGFYWRQDLHDGLYGISGNLIVPSNGAPGRFEGSRPTVQVDWQVSRHLSAHVNYIYVFNGHFAETSVHGTSTMSFISPWISYRF